MGGSDVADNRFLRGGEDGQAKGMVGGANDQGVADAQVI